MGRTSILLSFDEPADGIMPVDEAGGLNDLAVPAGLTRPTVVDGILGKARSFGSGKGFSASEKTVDQTRIRRDATIEAVINFDTGKDSAALKAITIRGTGDGTSAQKILWGLSMAGSVGGATATLEFRWFVTGPGTITLTSSAFAVASGQWYYVAAVRRWISTSSVAVDFYVNGRFISTATSTAGSIEDGVGATTTVGYRNAAGVASDHWLDKIDAIRVSNEARTGEEIRQTYRLMFEHPARAYEALRAFLPPGDVYSTDPSSAIQRELMVEGDLIGFTWNRIDRLLDDWLPDRAWESLARWETATKQFPKPGDSIDKRRLRVTSWMRKVHGYQKSEIVKAVAEILDLTEAQVQILRSSNRFVDEFTGSALGGAWIQDPNSGTLTVASGVLDIDFQTGDDARWDGSNSKAVRAFTCLANAEEAEVLAKWTTGSFSEGTAFYGLCLLNRATGHAHLFGDQVGTWKHRKIVDGVATTVSPGGGPGGAPMWMRLKINVDGTVNWEFSENGTEWGPWVVIAASVATITSPEWAGLFVANDAASAVGNGNAEFAAFHAWTPKGREVFNWYVFRDPLIAGTPDIVGAQEIVRRMQPAESKGHVAQSIEFLCDSATSLCDRDRLGT